LKIKKSKMSKHIAAYDLAKAFAMEPLSSRYSLAIQPFKISIFFTFYSLFFFLLLLSPVFFYECLCLAYLARGGFLVLRIGANLVGAANILPYRLTHTGTWTLTASLNAEHPSVKGGRRHNRLLSLMEITPSEENSG
jgi:hypothetical protein